MTQQVRAPLGVGLIGCGEIAMATLRAMEPLGAVLRVAAVQDIVESLASEVGGRLGVPHFTRAGDLLARDDVQMVIISTPHHVLAPLTIEAARAGKHVVCEKPMATTLEQADEAIAVCRESGVLLSVAYNSRYDGTFEAVRDYLARGAIGRIIRYQTKFFSYKPQRYWDGGYSGRAPSDWRQRKETAGGGVMLMNLSHFIDRVHWLTQLRPLRLFAEADTHATDVTVEDNISVVVRYDNGAIGSMSASSVAIGDRGRENMIHGTEGAVNLDRTVQIYTRRDDIEGLTPNAWTDLSATLQPCEPNARARMLAMFAEAVLSGAAEGPCPGHEARRTLALILAAYESAATHRPVSL